MQKNIILSLLAILLFNCKAESQIREPAKWLVEVFPKTASVGDIVELRFKAKIDEDWYMYSSEFDDPDLGPQLTVLSFTPNKTFELVGDYKPVNPLDKFDDTWEGKIKYFKKEAFFTQKVKILALKFKIPVNIEGQVCSDKIGSCIPFEKDLEINNYNLKVTPAKDDSDKREEKIDDKTIGKEGVLDEVKKDDVTNPKDETKTPAEKDTLIVDKVKKTGKLSTDEVKLSTESYKTSSGFGDMPLWKFLLLTFLAGLAAIFTPCVFPMIPLTVSFFTNKKRGATHAIFYGFSIIAIYTLLGAVVTLAFGAGALNEASTHWAMNLIFFLVFIVFALSFFGMFDIQLPSSFVNKMDEQSDEKGGFLGVFFMAFTLTLVSFSCTGPIVGTLLVASATGAEVLRPILGMAVFGSAFALPFMFFAFFPSAMNKLPQSGGWLNSVKVTLGFIELALAFKFLSMIDLVYHLGILDRDLNIAIWIAIAAFMGLYYLGKIQLPHDSPLENISVPRMLLALASFIFVIYLIPGMFGAPLKGLSGILPPASTHDFDLNKVVRQNAPASTELEGGFPTKRKHAGFLSLPHGLQGFFDYKEGLAYAQKVNKPVLLDFTGHGCANCRKMEEYVWAESAVKNRLQNDWVIISLYVDDRTELPESEWVISSFDGKVKKTIGKVNMDIELSRFNNNAQPFYILLDNNGELLENKKSEFKGYTGYNADVKEYVQFLDGGLKEFNNKN
ncbi:MAG: thiol:disulfide interchange protein [Arenicella sp.]|jgi:thiol:disulfide interchange protein